MVIGTLSPIEVTRAAAEASAGKEDLLIAQTNVPTGDGSQERPEPDWRATEWLDDVHIIPLDHTEVPATEI